MSQHLITALVPFYRGLDCLERTLVGLSRQTLHPDLWEAVICEDGSVEQTTDLISRYPNINIRRVCQERNGYRLASVRNLGILSARSPRIVLLDFDCIPLPYHLERHLNALGDVTGSATIGLRRFVDGKDISLSSIRSTSWWNLVVDIPSISGRGASVDKRIEQIRLLPNHPCPSNIFYGCNVGFWRSDALATGGFNEAFNGAHGYEDLEFAWRLQKHNVVFQRVDAIVYHQENEVVSEEERDYGGRKNYELLKLLAPGLAAFRAAGGAIADQPIGSGASVGPRRTA